ncbi:MAG TPA: acyltransferase [Flavisolibacter sp.]|nr:acyltransferase [Flavisolibacter sp.]
MKTAVKHIANRYNWIDYARGIAIILVVYRHSFEGIKRAGFSTVNYRFLEYANIIFFSFRMPLFFIVSGIFISGSLFKRGLNQFIGNKAKTILYPYFLWGILQITLQLLFGQYLSSQRKVSHYLDLFYLPREVEQFWYLYALFNVSVLYAIIKIKLKLLPKHQLLLGLALFLLSAFTAQNNIDLGFVNDIFHYYLFFALGDNLSELIRSENNRKFLSSWKLFFILLPLFIVSQIYFLIVNLNHSPEKFKYLYTEYYQPFAYILIALIGCCFIMNITYMLQQKNTVVLLRRIGFYSLYIYVCHVMITAPTRILLNRLLHISNVPFLLLCCVIAGVFIPILIYNLAMKLNMPWLYSLEKEGPKLSASKVTASKPLSVL